MDFKHLPEVVQSKHSVVVAERKRVKAKISARFLQKKLLTKDTHVVIPIDLIKSTVILSIQSIMNCFDKNLATMLNVKCFKHLKKLGTWQLRTISGLVNQSESNTCYKYLDIIHTGQIFLATHLLFLGLLMQNHLFVSAAKCNVIVNWELGVWKRGCNENMKYNKCKYNVNNMIY